MTLTEAKAQVADMLQMAGGDGDAVERALDKARRNARQFGGYTAAQDDQYATLKLALSDLTGKNYRR